MICRHKLIAVAEMAAASKSPSL